MQPEYTTQQDWEYAELLTDGWETVEIQIETQEQALALAQKHANATGRRVSVTTSVAWVNLATNSVEDRDFAPGQPQPIILDPQRGT